MFRLIIDIPLNMSEEKAADFSRKFVEDLKTALQNKTILDPRLDGAQINYRMSRDEDRQVRNYLIKDEQGHISTKKLEL